MAVIQHLGVRELDLSNWHASAVAEKLNHAVPAIKSSAAFLSFLRANLVLDPSASYANTPVVQPAFRQAQTHGHGRTRSSSLASTASSMLTSTSTTASLDDIDDIPELSLDILSDPAEKAEALELVKDSILEQRKETALSLVLHPVSLTALIGAVALIHHQTSATKHEAALEAIFVSALVATSLAVICTLTKPYQTLASTLRSRFLPSERAAQSFSRPSSSHSSSSPSSSSSHHIPHDRQDLILATRSGSTIISALILRLEPRSSHLTASGLPPTGPPSSGQSKRRSKGSSGNASPLKGGKGVVRAWTTARMWRGHGAGTELLHEAVRLTRERCGRDAEVGFAKEHAHSKMVLPEMFNGRFRRGERNAALALEKVACEYEPGRRRR